MKRSKGFTLIELLAVIVILAIIALIATPMVLKYIDNSKEGSNDVSVESILRAADNYYAASLLDKNTTYPKTIFLPDSSSELGLKGRQPDFGQVTINADGTTIIEVVYDEIAYTKYENETSISKNNVVIGDESLWTTDGKGTITAYNVSNVNDLVAAIELNFDSYYKYLNVAMQFASNNGLGSSNISALTDTIDNANTLEEVITQAETILGIDRSGLPLNLNQELDKIITEILKDKTNYSDAVKKITENASSIPYSADTFEKSLSGTTKYEDYLAYQEILNYIVNSNKTTIPNVVKHADGSFEKIIAIGDGENSINKGTIFGDIIIPYGIVDINYKAFFGSGLLSVIIPTSVKTIDMYAFGYNSIKILNIPGTIKILSDYCFSYNPIETLILNEGLEKIGNGAFYSNSLTTVTLPLSIKNIGADAFTSTSLKKVYRYRDASYSAATTAFGYPGNGVTVEIID